MKVIQIQDIFFTANVNKLQDASNAITDTKKEAESDGIMLEAAERYRELYERSEEFMQICKRLSREDTNRIKKEGNKLRDMDQTISRLWGM